MAFISQYMQVIIAAVVTLAALLLALLVWRAISPSITGRRGQRLGISEYHELDKTRRLILVRRDEVEHLIMIGGPQDIVIEQNINVPSFQTGYAPPIAETTAPPVRPAPRPPVFGDRRPPPLRSVEPAVPPTPPRKSDTDPA